MGYLPPLPKNYKGVIAAGFVALAVCAFFAVVGSRGVLHWRSLQRQQARAESIAYRLEQRNEALRTHVDRLQHDDAYLERLAREHLGWIKPGEYVFHVERNAAPAAVAPAQ